MDATTTQAVALLRRLRKEVERRQALMAPCDVRLAAIDRAIAALKAGE